MTWHGIAIVDGNADRFRAAVTAVIRGTETRGTETHGTGAGGTGAGGTGAGGTGAGDTGLVPSEEAGGNGLDGPRLPTTERLRSCAEAAHAATDDERARYFQSLLEMSYLVASVDGFAQEERRALAELLEAVTGAATTVEELALHFADLDEACRALGRRERMQRAAADFEDALGRAEALSFVTLVAAADGVLADPERDALAHLGALLEFPSAQTEQIVQGVLSQLEAALRAPAANSEVSS